MSTLLHPTIINITQEELLKAVREIVEKKMPHLVDEEFEIILQYDSYSYEHRAVVNIINPL